MTTIAESPSVISAQERNSCVNVPDSVRVMVEQMLTTPEWDLMNQLDEKIGAMVQTEYPLKHTFTPGLYAREIFMPGQTVATTRIHMTEHQFIVSKGHVAIFDGQKWTDIRAPYHGVTKPGARRALVVFEDTIWTTFHATDKTDPDEIAREITYSEGRFADLGMAAARKEIK